MKTFRKSYGLTLLALPGILLLFLMDYVPLYGLLIPFKDYKYNLGIWNSPWIGFDNFRFLFNGDILRRVLRNTLLYNLVFIALGTAVSVFFALLLREVGRKAVKAYQTVLFIPYFISWVVAGFAFQALLNMDYGILNKALEAIGRDPIMWYNDPKYWPVILIVVAIWKGLGYGAVIYYAAIIGVDAEYYEAARMDGATKLRQAVSITIPMIMPIITMMVILQIGKIFYSDFGLFYNVTMNSTLLYPTTDVIDTFVYRSLVDLGDIGMAGAAGFFQSVVGFTLVILTNYVVRKINADNSLF
ncbi:putative aldouronate transport system permease protein [Cohnella sp. OV330]|uniref:ABC transporter permease subunit n=1 Tax=Cohnella sp. OV330 TaxID=1855288 RepID=UPI0008E910BC|nr:ABC transporter permease subunit [Cohnella sp. OV330]SFB49671.1 putative aldouronate transport system permease protein [Cohnella sp. OV330]